MKKLFTAFVLLFMAVAPLVAQTVPEKSINIIASSLRPVQTDALTGVNIDPIQTDMSNRPCARIKMRVNRMTKAEIGQLEVKIIGGNAQVVRQMVADDGNGLIFEVTARENLRFYIQHPEFGESNDVQLAVEGNKEYYLDAELNQLFTITVASNTADAEIYIDEKFVGRTQKMGADFLCTIKDLLPGEHNLYLKFGGIATASQKIAIHSGSSLFFRQNVNIAGSRPQYVVFMVEPTNAIVNIDGKLLTATDGAVMTVLENGTYNYHVTASGYHSQSGTFTVHSAKVTKYITLQMDAATTVTLVADAGADIYINDKKVGTGRCEKLLTSGTYIFEARREGYRTQTISRTITSAEPQQTYTFKPLEPVYGRLDIVSTPLMASVAIDGKNVGETPLQLDNVLVGKRSITLSKSGYQSATLSVTIAEGKTESIAHTLTKVQSATSASANSTNIAKGETSAPYKVGDYYNENGKEGVVFEVDATGRHGKIVALTESPKVLQWCTKAEYVSRAKKGSTTTSATDGAYNMTEIKKIYGWQERYPAFAYCASLGDGWYLPAKEELEKLMWNSNVYNAVNKTLQTQNKPMLNKGKYYWSSTQASSLPARSWSHNDYGGFTTHYKTDSSTVRAVSAFGDSAKSVQQTPASYKQTSAPYKVGDYYNENGKEGVVFEVDATGRHGKIVALIESPDKLQWCTLEEFRSRATNGSTTISETNGAYNMTEIKKMYGWQGKYPAFAYCASLGDGWYLPAKNELEKLMLNSSVYNAVNKTLQSQNKPILNKGNHYWSSTQDSSYPVRSWFYHADGAMYYYIKYCSNTVRAVSAFGDSAKSVQQTPASYKQTSAPYKVGDYYNENGKEGVVFEVDATGRHGKIVALTESPKDLRWCTKAEYVSRAKKGNTSTSETNGAYNMTEIKKIKGWQKKYPAFAYCASLGDGWYLPAKEELEKLMLNSSVYNAVNETLQSQNKPRLNKGKYYWSSTQNRKNSALSWYYTAYGHMWHNFKNYSTTVRAVSTF